MHLSERRRPWAAPHDKEAELPRFRLVNLRTGEEHGVFEGADPAEAVAAMFCDDGYDVSAKGGKLVFPDPETARLCGDLGEVWEAKPAD